jgi:hypothetical protein
MWRSIRNGLADLFTSKKAIMAIAGVVSAGVARLGFHVDPVTVGLALTPIGVYVAAQAHVDRGKADASMDLELADRKAAQVEAIAAMVSGFVAKLDKSGRPAS